MKVLLLVLALIATVFSSRKCFESVKRVCGGTGACGGGGYCGYGGGCLTRL